MSAVETTTEHDHAKDLRELKDLIESSQVEEARKLAPILAERWPESKVMQHFAKVLDPPKVIRSDRKYPPGRPLDEDRAWVRDHGREYPGCWIITLGYRLLAADPDFQVAQQKAASIVNPQEVMCFASRQPPASESDSK